MPENTTAQNNNDSDKRAQLRRAALEYHEFPKPGKIAIAATKQMVNQHDLALAYSPGVAAPCEEIVKDPANAFRYTSRGNLVAVITNGTAVLGLGDIGALASKPVMEGKAVLFKKFAGVDVFDIEIDEKDPAKLVEVIAALEPTFGAVNLEDIKAPDCFYVERELRKRMKIPVFHNDQHGTAITVAAAIVNALKVAGKKIEDVKLVASGAGAAALACLNLLLKVGVQRKNVFVTDLAGVVYEGREELMDDDKRQFMQKTDARKLAEVMVGADVFLGLSAGNVLKPEMVATMAERPVIFALANPNPEILPEVAHSVRSDIIMATGRSDYPNQVNNVLCFPYIFRGALDCGATKITEAMKLACVHEIANLAKAETSAEVAAAYAGKDLQFGPDYIIPTPFDPRLITRIAPAVAKAAVESGVAERPIADMDAYRASLERFVYQTGMVMRPVYAAAKAVQPTKKRVAYAEGEDERVLRAAQIAIDDQLAHPILIGRPAVIEQRILKAGLRMRLGKDVENVNPEDDPRFRQYWETYHGLMQRNGVTVEAAKAAVRRSTTVIAALSVHLGDADAMLCGTVGRFDQHLDHIRDIIGVEPGAPGYATLNALMLTDRTLFVTDTYVNDEPGAELLAAIAKMAADEVHNFGLPPKVAFVSHSNFGSSKRPSALRMRAARDLFRAKHPDISCDGEMHGDSALSAALRERAVSDSTLQGDANLLVCPSLDAANILFNVLKITVGHGVTIGPILLGTAAPAHVLTSSATVRRVVNMTALAVAEAQSKR